MDKYHYEPVKSYEDAAEKKRWTPLLRQSLVASGALSVMFCVGICLGAPTIFIQQLRKEANSTDAVSPEMASWLSSCSGYSSIPWIFVLTAVSHVYGRRIAYNLVSISTIVMFICFYCSITTTHLLISSIMQGMSHASSLTITVMVLSEFSSPVYRGIILSMKTSTVFSGVWFANALGTFLHWSYIPLFGLICSFYCLITFSWPESPYWLASKGKFDECRKAHRWLKGRSTGSEDELARLVNGNFEIYNLGSIKDLKNKQFYKPTIVSSLMIMQYFASGKIVCSIYAIEILKKMTSSESVAYASMLILDGATVFSMFVGCFLCKVIKRRVQMFTTSCIGLVFIFTLSLYLYLVKLAVITESNVLTIIILTIFSIAMGCGPAIMTSSTYAELIPLKFKNLCTIVVSVLFEIIFSTVLKIFPYIYSAFGLHGTFFCYGVCMAILTCVLYKVLPETKDKTLQEIEEYFK